MKPIAAPETCLLATCTFPALLCSEGSLVVPESCALIAQSPGAGELSEGGRGHFTKTPCELDVFLLHHDGQHRLKLDLQGQPIPQTPISMDIRYGDAQPPVGYETLLLPGFAIKGGDAAFNLTLTWTGLPLMDSNCVLGRSINLARLARSATSIGEGPYSNLPPVTDFLNALTEGEVTIANVAKASKDQLGRMGYDPSAHAFELSNFQVADDKIKGEIKIFRSGAFVVRQAVYVIGFENSEKYIRGNWRRFSSPIFRRSPSKTTGILY